MINAKEQKHESQVAITENFARFSRYLKFQHKTSCMWEYLGSEFVDLYTELNELHYIEQRLCYKSKIYTYITNVTRFSIYQQKLLIVKCYERLVCYRCY